MYDELVKRVRQVAEEVCDDYDVDPYNGEQRFFVIEEAANAIEELQATLCNWCAVCPEDKRDLSTCEIYESCRAEPPKEE